MRDLQDQTLVDLYDEPAGRLVADWRLTRCEIRECVLSPAIAPGERTEVRDVELVDCTADGSLVFNPVLRRVRIDTLRTGAKPLFTYGAVFDQVVITGEIDTVLILPKASTVAFPDPDEAAFQAANAAFYRGVSWALDIRGVRAAEMEIFGVPSRLIRRDAETTAVIRREVALADPSWRELDLKPAWWKSAIDRLVTHGFDEAVLVAPLRHRHWRVFVDGLAKLRSAGVADVA